MVLVRMGDDFVVETDVVSLEEGRVDSNVVLVFSSVVLYKVLYTCSNRNFKIHIIINSYNLNLSLNSNWPANSSG